MTLTFSLSQIDACLPAAKDFKSLLLLGAHNEAIRLPLKKREQTPLHLFHNSRMKRFGLMQLLAMISKSKDLYKKKLS